MRVSKRELQEWLDKYRLLLHPVMKHFDDYSLNCSYIKPRELEGFYNQYINDYESESEFWQEFVKRCFYANTILLEEMEITIFFNYSWEA